MRKSYRSQKEFVPRVTVYEVMYPQRFRGAVRWIMAASACTSQPEITASV